MFESLIAQFGYFFIYLGTVFEGEVVMVLGGIFAEKGLLNIYLVILFGFLGIMSFDSYIFLLGYKKGEKILGKIPPQKKEKLLRYIKKGDVFMIFLLRFLYGMRMISLLTLGSAKVSKKKFFTLYPISCIIWAIVFAYGGFFFGKTFGEAAKKIELNLFLIIIVIILIYLIKQFLKTHFHGKKL